MSEVSLANENGGTPITCAGGCPRYAAMKPLLVAAGWLAAAVAALSVTAVPFDSGESLCGVWGCFPPVPALAAMHLFWCAVLGAGVHAVYGARPGYLRPVGVVLVLAAVAATAAVVGGDLDRWLARVPDGYRHLWPRRVGSTLATTTDIPLVQSLAVGVACLVLAGRYRVRGGTAPDDGAAPCGEPRPGGSVVKTKVTLGFALFGLAVWGWGSPGRGEEKDKPVPAPEFTGVTEWVNAKPMKLADLKGKVVVVHFWTNGCINCVHNYPHYRAWQDKYKDDKGLVIVGVHTPEFEAEKDVGRVKDRMAKNKLTFAVAVDNDGTNWKAWGNRYWPCVYLVDKVGNVRQRWEGELGDDGFKKVTRAIEGLLAEQPPKGK